MVVVLCHQAVHVDAETLSQAAEVNVQIIRHAWHSFWVNSVRQVEDDEGGEHVEIWKFGVKDGFRDWNPTTHAPKAAPYDVFWHSAGKANSKVSPTNDPRVLHTQKLQHELCESGACSGAVVVEEVVDPRLEGVND
jgi:hypothetical protein